MHTSEKSLTNLLRACENFVQKTILLRVNTRKEALQINLVSLVLPVSQLEKLAELLEF